MKLNRTASLFLSIALLASVVVGYSTTANAAGNPNCNAVDGDYIISFAPGVSVDKEIKAAPGRAISATQRYETVVNGFAATLTAEQVCAYQKRPNIRSVEVDAIATADTDQPTTNWDLARIDSFEKVSPSYTYSYNTTGNGVTAYVIDTGIEITHPDFGGRAKFGANYAGGTNSDCNGHGTHVAGTIGGTKYGVAKNVNLVAVKVLSCSGSGQYSGVIKGLDFVAKNHATKSVANMSLGGPFSLALEDAVNALVASGVVLVVAAGNEGVNACSTSPASTSSAITVAASDVNDQMASWSNFGQCVDVIAPGVSITSDWLKGKTNTISGTSMASPHVAGIMARYLEVNSATLSGVVPSVLLNPNKITLSAAAKLSTSVTPNLLIYMAPTN